MRTLESKQTLGHYESAKGLSKFSGRENEMNGLNEEYQNRISKP